MRNRVRMIVLLSCLLFLVSASACGLTYKGVINGRTADQLRENHTLMFTATEFSGDMTWAVGEMAYDSSDNWSDTRFSVYYDGNIEGYSTYNISGYLGEFSAQLSPEDYDLLFNFLSDGFINGSYDIEVEAYDGAGWFFECFDTSRSSLHTFSGFTDDIEVYEEIEDMLYSYRPAFEAPLFIRKA